MLIEPIDEKELRFLDLFRVSVSEKTVELRKRAIRNVRHDVIATLIRSLPNAMDQLPNLSVTRQKVYRSINSTASARHEAAWEFAATLQRYEDRNERKLNIAEEAGFLIIGTIGNGRRQGVHTPDGILSQVRDLGIKENVRGAKDSDTIRQTWMCYRGVVHLGMAIGETVGKIRCLSEILELAETYRCLLSSQCPKGISKPYVPEPEQISFPYISTF